MQTQFKHSHCCWPWPFLLCIFVIYPSIMFHHFILVVLSKITFKLYQNNVETLYFTNTYFFLHDYPKNWHKTHIFKICHANLVIYLWGVSLGNSLFQNEAGGDSPENSGSSLHLKGIHIKMSIQFWRIHYFTSYFKVSCLL